MTGAALGQLIGAALGIAISPVSIATVILLLLSRRGRSAAVGFLLGWSVGIAAAVTAFTLVSAVVPLRVPGAARTGLGVIQLIVGIVLLAFAVAQWIRRPRTAAGPPRTPGWLRGVDRTTPAIAFAVGAAMAVNPPNLLLSLAGGLAIGGSGLTGAATVAILTLFTLVAASSVAVPVIAHVIAGDAVERTLSSLRAWLSRHSSAILTVIFAVVGMLAVAQGIAALSMGGSVA